MTRTAASVALPLLAALAGCQPETVTPADAARDDVAEAALDVSDAAPDLAPPDAAADLSDAAADARRACPTLPEQPPVQTGALCDAANVVDLTTLPPGAHYFGWVHAPRRADDAVMTAGCAARGVRPLNRQVAHRYRMRTRAHLRVSTDHLGSYCGPEGLRDTYVGLFQTCAVEDREVPLGCSVDSLDGTGDPATVTSDVELAAGTEVYVVVGTVAQGGRGEPVAPFELSLEEVAPPRPGDPCNPVGGGPCPPEHTCVGASPRLSQVGRCVADGTAVNTECRGGGAPDGGVDERCDPGLRCAPFNFSNGICLVRHEFGEACDGYGDACPRYPYFNCVRTDPSDPTIGRCVMDGSAAGAACMGSARTCAEGLTCGGELASDSCAATVGVGEVCDPYHRTTVCREGASCAPAGGDRFRCRADGASPGTACRAEAPRCDAGLTCTTATGAGRCAATLAADDAACDPRFGSTRCPDGRVCLATATRAGRCVAPTRESDGDNNHFSLAEPVTLPAAVRGSLPTAGDVDCFAFDLPRGATLRAETNDGLGTCPPDGDTVLTIHDARGLAIDGSDDGPGTLCSIVDGAWARSALRGLPAGRYTACVWSFRGERPIGEYVLDITAERP